MQTSTPDKSLSGKLRISNKCNPKQDQTLSKTQIKLLPEVDRIGPTASMGAVQDWEKNISSTPLATAYQIPLDNRDLNNMSCSMLYPPPPPPSLMSFLDASSEESLHTEEVNVPHDDCASGCLVEQMGHLTDIPVQICQDAALLCSDNPLVPEANRGKLAEPCTLHGEQVNYLLAGSILGIKKHTHISIHVLLIPPSPFYLQESPLSPTCPTSLLPPPPPPPYTARPAATGMVLPHYSPSQYPVYPAAPAAAAPSQPIVVQQVVIQCSKASCFSTVLGLCVHYYDSLGGGLLSNYGYREYVALWLTS